MNRSSLFVLSSLVFSTACFGQTTTGDSQTLQALLFEVRQLRQDLQTTTIAGQRVQILIYRLQGQEAADVKRFEDSLSGAVNPATQRKDIEEGVLPQLKTRLESLGNQEQQLQTREIEAEQQLRAEEVKLSDLRDQLDRLDKTLENAGRRPGGSAQ